MSDARGRAIGDTVRAVRRRVLAHVVVAMAAGAAAGAGGLLLSSWFAGRVGALQRPTLWPLLLWIAAIGAIGLWLVIAGRRIARWDVSAAAAEIERGSGLPLGSVRGAVEPAVEHPGVSSALLGLHRSRMGRHVSSLGMEQLGHEFTKRAILRARLSAALAFGVVLALGAIWMNSRSSANEAWAALRHPLEVLRAPPLPAIAIVAETDRVRRGEDLPVRVSAPARDSVELIWQSVGEIARGRWLPVSAGIAESDVPSVQAPTRVWARATDGALSDTLGVEPIDPLLLIGVEVRLRYPKHTGRAIEVYTSPLPQLTVPAGTRLNVEAKTTRPVARAVLLREDGREIAFQTSDDRRLHSSFVARSGVWRWDVTGAAGDTLEGPNDELDLVTVADSVPNVRISYPGLDTLMSVEMIQPLVVDVRDDYGLASVELVSWRVSAWGEAGPRQIDTLSLPDAGPRAHLNPILDARSRALLPGDTLRYFARAFDNSPSTQEGRSREFALRLPDLDELRQRTLALSDDLVRGARELARDAAAHQEAIDALRRSTEVSPPPGTRDEGAAERAGVEFRDTEAARQALEAAAELLDQADEIASQLEELQAAIEKAGLTDEAVLERLREIESLYERMMTPELEERIEQLRESLGELDPEAIREAIKELAEGSADFRERVEQSVELLQRAALEQEFATLETQADELADEHQELAEASAAEEADEEAMSRRAEGLADRSEELAEQVGELSRELEESGELAASDRAQDAQASAREATEADRQAARQMAGDSRRGTKSAQHARQEMQQAASSLQQGRRQMQENWRSDVVESLNRARAETLELARRQRALNERLSGSEISEDSGVRSDQVALKRGLDQIERQLSEAMESTLLIDPGVLQSAGQTQTAMEQLLEQMGDGTRRHPVSQGLGRRVSEGLADLAFRLMEASEQAASAESGTGVQEALEQLAQMAEQQGQLNSQTGQLSPGGLSEAILSQMRQIGAQQRGVAEGLQQLDQSMGPRDQVMGSLDELAQEAADIAEQLESGRLDESVIERQRELFQRLLDAGRTMERDEFERERRAERATPTEILRPGELSEDVLRGRAYPHPDASALKDYPPAIRRLIMEYFDRINGSSSDGS